MSESATKKGALEFDSVFGQSWSLAGKNYGKLLLAMLIVYALPFLAMLVFVVPTYFLTGGDFAAAERHPLKWFGIAAYSICWIIAMPAWLKACVMSAEGNKFAIKELLPQVKTALCFLGTMILVLFAVVLASFFLVLPGIFVGVKLQQATFFAVDQDMNPIEAISASWRATSGSWWTIFGLDFVFGLIFWLSGLTVVGTFFMAPVFGVAMANIYACCKMRAQENL